MLYGGSGFASVKCVLGTRDIIVTLLKKWSRSPISVDVLSQRPSKHANLLRNRLDNPPHNKYEDQTDIEHQLSHFTIVTPVAFEQSRKEHGQLVKDPIDQVVGNDGDMVRKYQLAEFDVEESRDLHDERSRCRSLRSCEVDRGCCQFQLRILVVRTDHRG